jgi:hypothetical protein
VCNAVAAADRRAIWDLAFASLVAQSGLILSVVITVEAVADIDVVRLLWVCGVSVAEVPVVLDGEGGGIAELDVSRP